MHVEEEEEEEEEMEEEKLKKGAKGRPCSSSSNTTAAAAALSSDSGSESESDEMKISIESKNEEKKTCAAEKSKKDEGQDEIEEEEEEEEDEESDEEEEEEEDEEEESEEDDDDDDDIGVINKKNRKKLSVLESESSDDGEGDDCPICLNRLKYQDIGTPEACDHNFCLDCIQLWARNVNTCPVDRREFQLILARHAREDDIFKKIPVSGKSFQTEDDDADVNEDFTYCELCGRSDREDRLLLCDGCDLGFHCECLDPPLDSVPVEEWFCPDCAEANTQRSGRMLNDLDAMQYLLEENSIDGIPYLRPRRRQIARTRISERVRARIQEYREGLARLVCDDEEPEASDEEGEGPSTRLSRTRSQTRQSETKRKQSSRKKTKKGTTGKQKSSYTKKKLRRRTKTPGKAQIFDRLQKVRTSRSKSRLAGRIGLTKSRMSLRKSDRATAAQILKEDLYGAKPLSITGGKHDLDPFPDDDSYNRSDEPQASTSVFSASAAAKRSSKYSASALLSRQPVARPLLRKLPEDNPGSNIFSSHCSNSGASSAASSSGGLDLLGSIMMDQNLLHLESKDVKINRDGSLTAKKAVTASVIKERKQKTTCNLFFDSKDDENSNVHMDSDNEMDFECSSKKTSFQERNNTNNNDTNTATEVNDDDDDEGKKDSPEEELIDIETETKCSDVKIRDSETDIKPCSSLLNTNEISEGEEGDKRLVGGESDEEEKDEGGDVEEDSSFESHGTCKTEEEVNVDGNEEEEVNVDGNEEEEDNVDGNEEEEEMKESRTEPTETDVENQTTELNEDKVWSEKAPGRNQSSENEGVEEEDNNNQDGDGTYKDEPKDGCSSERVDDDDDEEESEDNEEEVEAGSEQGSSSFSPAAGVSPRDEENQDVEQNSDEEMVKTEEAVPAAELVSEEEEEENIREASSGDDKIEEPSEDFENIQDKQGPEDGLKREEVADNVEEEEEEGKEAVDETNSTSSPLLAEPTGEEDEEDVVKEEEEEEAEMSGEHTKCLSEEEEEENNRDIDAEQNGELALESNQAGDQEEFARTEESEENGEEALAVENLAEEEEERDKKEKLEEVVEEISEHYDDSASKDSEEMVKSHREELENFERQNEIGDEKISPVSGSESDLSSAGNGGEEEEEEEKPKVPISELPRIPKRNRREGYRREKTSKGGDGPELKSVLGRVDMGEYKMGRSWEKKESRRTRWDPDEWGQAEREAEGLSTRDRKSEGGKSYHSDRSESSRESEKYSFEYKESKSRKRRRERSRSRSRGHKESVVEYRDIPHHRHSPERSKNRRRNRSRSGSREKSFDYDKSHKRKSRGRSRDRSQSRKSRRHRSYSRSPSRKRDKERGSLDKRRHREERKRGEERTHKRHSDKSDPDESRKKRSSHEEFDEWDDGSCQVVDFDESGTPPKATTSKKSAECFYEAQMSNEKISENFFNRSRPQEKGLFKTDKVEDSAPFYNARGSNKKHKFVDRFYKAPHLRNPGTEKFPIHLSEDESEEINIASKASRCSDDHEKEANSQDSGDSEYDPAFPTESGSPLREGAIEEEEQEQPAPPKILEESTPLSTVVTVTAAAAATSIGTTTTTTAEAVVVPPPPPTTTTAVAEELASSGPIDEAPPTGSQGILGESGFLIAESPNLQNIPMQPQNITFPMGIRMMPPGMQPGMPQHLLMNPMFLNRPPPFGRLPRISGPVGRLGWSMNPSGLMQIPPNRFGPARMGPGGAMPPSPGLLNGGGFDGIPQEPGQPVPPFKQHPCDPRNISSHTGGPQGPPGQIAPRAGLPPPHLAHIPPPGPLLQHPPPPPPSSQQMHIPPPTSDPLSSLSLDSQTVPLHIQHGLGKNAQPSSDENSASSNFCVPELNQISKLIKAHAQALQNKQRNPSSLQGGDIDVFKIPLPPMAPPAIPPPTLGLPIVPPPESTTHNYTSTTKLYKNGQSKLLANSHTSSELASESTEVVDMDVASPLDDEVAIELPASPELDDIDESKINMKDSSVIELSVPEDMPASAVELTNLTNKEKHPSSQRIKKSNRKSSQQRTVSPTSTKTSYMGYMKKLQIQERVVDEVKLAIKPFYSGKKIDKNEYKEILRKSVPKICHSKSGNINPAKIKALIEAYVDKMCKTRRYMERKKKGSLKANGEQQQMKKPSR